MSDKCDCGHGQHVHVGYTDGCGLCDTCMGFRITPTARVEAERAIADVLAGHRYRRGLLDCVCGWKVAPMSSDMKWEHQHEAHLASVLADLMAERQAEAWDEGHGTTCDGIHDRTWSLDGCEQYNHYRPDPKDTRDE